MLLFIILLTLSVLEGFLLGGYILLSKKLNAAGNKFLAYFIITLSLLLLNVILDETGVFAHIPFLKIIDDIEWAFLLPTFVFLFILHRVEYPLKNSKKLFLLYIPFIYSGALSLIFDFDILFHFYKLSSQQLQWFTIAFWIETLLIIIFILTIFPISYFYIKTTPHIEDRKWLNYLVTIIYFLLIIWIVIILTSFTFAEFDNWVYLKGLGLTSTIIIHWVAYLGIIKNKLYRDKKEVARLLDNQRTFITTDTNNPAELTIPNSLKKEVFTSDNPYYLKLEKLCKEEQLYRDPTLSRDKVASILGISPGYVSQFINAITGENFATYINDYRVESVKKLIIDTKFDNYSLLALGLESGFTSKTAFYTAFKKGTGMTPNAYKKSHK